MHNISKEEFTLKVGRYFPVEAIDFAFRHFDYSDFSLKVTKPRLTKKGDFRYFKNKNQRPIITINDDLCTYDFLLVYLHELAHYQVYVHSSVQKIKPHGEEWRDSFKNLLRELLDEVSLPEDVTTAFEHYIPRIQSSTASDIELERVFDRYRKKEEGLIYLRDLKEGDLFVWRKELFCLNLFIRTRARCTRLKNQKMYLMSGMLKVKRAVKD